MAKLQQPCLEQTAVRK